MNPSDKVIVVTGGLSGLGEATVLRLKAVGAKPVIFDLAAAEKTAEAGVLAIDVCDATAVRAAVNQVLEEYGRIDGLVNCAGVAPAQKILQRDGSASNPEDFARVIQINVNGTFNMCTSVAEAMVKRYEEGQQEELGVIINTASIAAYDGQKGQCAYAASKGAIVSLTLPLARDLAAYGVRVMTVAPGVMATPMMRAMPDKVQEALASTVPFPKRMGLPEEYALLVQQIFENPYLNAEVIRLDGALRMH